MSLTRRDFVEVVGGAAAFGPIGSPRIRAGSVIAPALIRLDSNENPYGPFPSSRAALEGAISDGGRYPTSQPLVDAIAARESVEPANVLLTVGATEGLALTARLFTATDRPLVTAAPTYAAIATTAEALGHPVVRVPLTDEGRLDLGAMASAAPGAGIVYLCNPQNPTGTLLSGDEIAEVVGRIGATSPDTTIVIGEAYHEYVDDPRYRTAAPAAVKNPRLLVNRTFSKLYGLAGLRLGYLIGHADTIRRIGPHRVSIGASSLGIAAALAALGDDAERLRQRRLNREGREAAERALRQRGWRFYPAAANYLFVAVNRDVTELRAACQAKGLLIGRLYPPADRWARLTIGTPDEMKGAFAILDEILARPG